MQSIWGASPRQTEIFLLVSFYFVAKVRPPPLPLLAATKYFFEKSSRRYTVKGRVHTQVAAEERCLPAGSFSVPLKSRTCRVEHPKTEKIKLLHYRLYFLIRSISSEIIPIRKFIEVLRLSVFMLYIRCLYGIDVSK